MKIYKGFLFKVKLAIDVGKLDRRYGSGFVEGYAAGFEVALEMCFNEVVQAKDRDSLAYRLIEFELVAAKSKVLQARDRFKVSG